MTLERLAEVVRYSKSHIARIEVADVMVPPDLPSLLDAAFGTDGSFLRLYGLAKREAHPDKYRRRMELEARATTVREFNGQFLSGLVQTEDYMRTIFCSFRPQASEEVIDEMVAARLSRQEILRAESPPDLSIILDEAALRRPVGSADVWRGQLLALVGVADTPASMLQVLPFEHGVHAFMGSTVALWTFEDGRVVACEESTTVCTVVEDGERLRLYNLAYDRLRGYALSPTASVAMIRSIAEALPA